LATHLKGISNGQYLILVELAKILIRQNTNRTRVSKKVFLKVLMKLYKEIYKKEENQSNKQDNQVLSNGVEKTLNEEVKDSSNENDKVLEPSASNEVDNSSTLEAKDDIKVGEITEISIKEDKTINLEESSNVIPNKNNAAENTCNLVNVEKKKEASIGENIFRFFRGVNITVILSAGGSVTGELFDCGKHYIVIKNNTGLHYINEDKIICFA
jgi:hypothetical protein